MSQSAVEILVWATLLLGLGLVAWLAAQPKKD